ncbi:PspA/IM30 family protein [Fictibacillus aquaticus]|uniref:Modulator protein n=1 Tax=Fictibacillus aquaticus TaxID=2021314 RepID=A0A235F7J7_9BACL|nr:PspA/IM30 family protein [Fictibacillus aquaticus]OYD57290.1 modulator protein [Fictibacillus aquaticus]
MNAFERLKNTIMADIHDLMDKKEEKNPILLLNQYLRQSEQEVARIGKLVERQRTLLDQFVGELREAEEKAAKRAGQAELAQRAGEQDLYDFAVIEKEQYELRAAQLKESGSKAEKDLEQLEQKYEQMKHKLKDMYIKRMELMGRENVVRANRSIDRVLKPEDASKQPFRFEDIEMFIERLEQKVNSEYNRSSMEARFAQLEKELKKEEAPGAAN